uniref:Uncharacterized protein n=1 Tax=Rhizophora mucronata TaxID=61149 RepID=A0A2P2PY12_RHIMU
MNSATHTRLEYEESVQQTEQRKVRQKRQNILLATNKVVNINSSNIKCMELKFIKSVQHQKFHLHCVFDKIDA